MAYIGIGPASFTNNLTNVQILDDISSGFNGNTATFNLTANSVPFQAVSDRALMVILGGVIQAPGVDYTINGSQITFTTNPLSGLTFYARNIYGLNALNGVNDGIVGPPAFTPGGPTWDSSGNVTVSGNLTVQGATTTIQSTTLDVVDKDIKLASNQSTNAGIDTAGLLWGTTAVKLKYYNNGGTNPGLNIEGTNVGIGVTAPTAKLDVDGDVKFTGATSGRDVLWDKSDDELKVKDNTKISFGTDRDLQLSHNNSDSVISHIGSATGNLKILSGGAQSIECIKAGAVTIAHNGGTKLTTTSSGVSITGTTTSSGSITVTSGNITASDGGVLINGAGGAILYLNDSNDNPDYQVQNIGGDFAIKDGTNNVERLHIDSGGRIGLGIDNPEDYFSSYNRVVMGRTNDTGGMTIRSGTTSGGYISFAKGTSGNQAYRGLIAYQHSGDYFTFSTDVAERLRITSTGITVTGEVAASQDYPNYRPEFDFNFAAVKKLDSRMTFTRAGEASYHDGIGSVKFVSDNVPRFDHDIVTGECKGLLVEPAGTNYSWYSRTFDSINSGSWVPQNGGATPTVTANTHTAPDGTSSGDFMADTISGATGTAFNGNVVQQQHTAGANVKHTFSLYVKLLTATQATIYIRDGATGSVSSTSAVNIKDWQRLVVTSSANLTNSTVHGFYIGNTNGTIAVWGSQIERSSYVSSYIRTEGGANGTRVADFPRIETEDFTDMISQEAGTLIAEFDNQSNDGYVLSLDAGGSPKIGMVNSDGYQLMGTQDNGGSLGTTDNGTVLDGTNKFALAYQSNNAAISINGNTATVDTNYTPLPTTTFLWFGLRQGQYDHLGGAISRVIYYKQRLSNSQLKTLTS